jgi:hypothetical protein
MTGGACVLVGLLLMATGVHAVTFIATGDAVSFVAALVFPCLAYLNWREDRWARGFDL